MNLMGPVGVIANPMSGRDVRRLAARARRETPEDKRNQLERIFVGAAAAGAKKVLLMPDCFRISAGAAELLTYHEGTRDRAVAVLVGLADPAKSDPFASLHALDALSRLEKLSSAHVETLKKTNMNPGSDWPGRVQKYVSRLNPNVVGQFSSK